jgi:hypothetical protein
MLQRTSPKAASGKCWKRVLRDQLNDMKRFLLFVILTVLTLSLCASAQDRPLRVLFIGNSYTYFNNLPQMLEKMAAAIGPRSLETQMVVEGGATLQDTWEKGGALKALHSHDWDYVVLQDQSDLGNVYIVNGESKTVDPADFWRYARLFDAEIRKQKAKTIFYSTWAKENAEPREQQALDHAYMSIARELKEAIAPVGVVWQRLRMQKPQWRLYIEDHSHPTPLGTYIAAVALYTTMFGNSPVGLPSRIEGNAVDVDGNVDHTGTSVLADIPPRDAEIIQKTAWQTYLRLKAAGGYFKARRPPLPVSPKLPRGRAPKSDELVGVWAGRLKFYPVPWPANMTLTIRRDNGKLHGDLRISFEGHPDADKTPPIANFELTRYGISFQDSKGINGKPVVYRASFTGGRLNGIAELRAGDQYAIGTWVLKRQP